MSLVDTYPSCIGRYELGGRRQEVGVQGQGVNLLVELPRRCSACNLQGMEHVGAS